MWTMPTQNDDVMEREASKPKEYGRLYDEEGLSLLVPKRLFTQRKALFDVPTVTWRWLLACFG
jgi:hypothetical protein